MVRTIKNISEFQIEQMKNVINDLNYEIKQQLNQEKEQRNLEFKRFKDEQNMT
jgi:hypothetical protein